jgi:hypothetical protein
LSGFCFGGAESARWRRARRTCMAIGRGSVEGDRLKWVVSRPAQPGRRTRVVCLITSASNLIDAHAIPMDTWRVMKEHARSALCFAAMFLAGCGSPSGTIGTSPVAPNLTGNWQIQTNITSQNIPPQALLLLGALNSSGSQVTGTFRFTNLANPTACGLSEVVALAGTIDSNNNLTLASAAQPNGSTIKVALGIGTAQP